MSEIVERVARAMEATIAGCTNSSDVNPIIDPLHPDLREALPVMARAAIAALREPSHEMVTAGGFASFFEDQQANAGEVKAASIWRAMCDAALKP